MITDDEVLRLFERADPARFDDDAAVVDAAGYLDALRTGSRNVPMIELTPTEPTKGHRRAIVLSAAAAAVVIVAGAVVLATRGDDDTAPVTNQPPPATDVAVDTVNDTAAEVARGFLEAYGAFDADRAFTYLADIADADWATPEELRLNLAWLEAVGHQQRLNSCDRVRTSAASIALRCTYDFHSFGSDQLGKGPFHGSYFDLTVRDGEIIRASENTDIDVFSPQMWSPFADWIDANYPADADVMYTDASRGGPRYTEESIQLWEQHIREYVDSQVAALDDQRVGFIGLPPEGATPSTPERGELVVYLAGPESGSRTWVYADGRLIWHRSANLPEGANEYFTGFLEQRLTPEGVELVRSEAVSLMADLVDNPGGELQRTDVLESDELTRQACSWNLCEIKVRNNGRIDHLVWPVGVASPLVERITDPASWLPASAWEDQEIKAYVPSNYQVVDMQLRDPTALPEPARDLILNRRLTTEEVRAIDKALDDAGLSLGDRGIAPSPFSLRYRVDPAGEDNPTATTPYIIILEPYLPHGVTYCQHCG